MYLSNQFILNKNPLLKKYLREHSYYYKLLNRDESMIKNLINDMENEYKLTPQDKLNKVKDNLHMLNTFIDIIK